MQRARLRVPGNAGHRLRLRAVVFRPDGSQFLESSVEGSRDEDVAVRAAQELLDAGAGEILSELR